MATTPWTIEFDEGQMKDRDYRIRSAEGELLISDTQYYPTAPDAGEAHQIVKAVNSHDALVAALAWIDTHDPEIVAAAEAKFGFSLAALASPGETGGT